MGWSQIYLAVLGIAGAIAVVLVALRGIRRRHRPTATDAEVREARARGLGTTSAGGTWLFGSNPDGGAGDGG